MDVMDPQSGSSAPESVGAASPPEEHLPTTRLPPVSSPPVSRSPRPGTTSSASAPLAPALGKEAPPSEPRPSFLPARTLTGAEKAANQVQRMRQAIGVACAGLGLGLALSGLVVGLLVGLRGISTDASTAAAVDVALIVTRGAIVWGMLAFGCGLIFFAARLLLGRDLLDDGAQGRSSS